MAAGMHHALVLRGMRSAGFFENRQRVHIGAQADDLRRRGLAALDDADHAGLADPGHHLVAAEIAQMLRNNPCRPVHVILQFGMHMQVAPPRGDVVRELMDAVDDGHD